MSSSSSQTIVSPVVAHIPRTTNPVDDFFGLARSSSRTWDSRSQCDELPAYVDAPEYTLRAQEPVTLAMYLFKFGFLFPPFWILGVIILLSPLRAPAPANTPGAWLPEKTDAERQVILNRMRTTELKWARRCLYALLALVHIIIAIVIGVVAWHALRK
ncbi:hypothetical protein MSAN_00408000 [Mycena sanguinolenta]|uniref:Uncharacterized protein n=1 Tax=Mycena sanguinolenta TaxID=230812 RepID=A0A8H6ZDB4_9AGAR|nr:hypothetical protein MSAN_00408000 [Mycena sanguinolenta]